jgi:dihydroorotate dehydrogenase electron transfer subunit
LHAAYYADRACQASVEILENDRIARDTFRLRICAPQLARRILPGQFLMLRLAGTNDPLLARPFALYDTVVEPASSAGEKSGSSQPTGSQSMGIDVVYLVVGKMTAALAQCRPGQLLDVWGPLGNGFAPLVTSHLVMVAGGIGQTPFMALAREALGLRRYGEPQRSVAAVPKVTFCYGARTRDYLAGVDDFRQLGVDVRLSTDDGSEGHHGFVTDLLRDVLDKSPNCRVVCCGPERMMEAVAHLCAERHARCEVSLETPMACGIGICFSCVAKVRDASGAWDYKRTCVEGPVFDAEKIEW